MIATAPATHVVYLPRDLVKRMIIGAVAAWVKPFAVFKPNVNPGYCWEPVIFRGARTGRSRQKKTVRDFLECSITLRKGLVGAKPREFCFWVFDLLGLASSDSFSDLYPGTGIVGRCWDDFCGRESKDQPQRCLFSTQ